MPRIYRPLVLLALVVSLCVPAAPVEASTIWTLQGVTFDDRTAATGSFTYNPALDEYSNWNLLVEPAAFMPGYNYQPGADGAIVGTHSATQVDFVAFTDPSGRYLRLAFTSPLTDAGGVIDLAVSGVSWECDNCATQRLVTGGAVVGGGAPVPEPGSMLLLGTGLVGLSRAWKKRRG